MPFSDVSASALRRLAAAVSSGQSSSPLSTFAVQRVVQDVPQSAVDAVVRLSREGMSGPHLALLLEEAARAVEVRLAAARELEFVWTGPEGPNAHVRDTAVVVEQLFSSAERSVLVSTFVVQQGATLFAPLARRMTERPELQVRLFLHIGRTPNDTRLSSLIVSQFVASFSSQWPHNVRRPSVYHDPRGVAEDVNVRANWHAKCVVVDDAHAFITSANLTEWAYQRNVEAGVLVHNSHFARQVRQQFDELVSSDQLHRLPGF